jgi:heptosyltransferase-2
MSGCAPREILIRAPNWLGDLVMSTPGFRALRSGFPEARIHLLVRPGLAPLVAGAPWFDEILPLRSYHAGPLAFAREAAALRRRRFDLGLCIPDSWSSALLLRAAGISRVVGYRRGGRGLLLSAPVRPPVEWGRRRMVSRERFVLELIRTLGCAECGTHLELFTTLEEEARADRILAERGLDLTAPTVALSPGASYGTSKLWPAESFSQVGDAACAAGAQVVVLGGPEEEALANGVVAGMRAPANSLAGATDLGALKAVLRRCRVLVCNDAGARHVAVAFGVPCVVLMGPTSLEKTGSNLESVRVLENEVACRPCYERVCPIDHRCMTGLEPARVSRAMLDLLDRVDGGADEGLDGGLDDRNR